MKENVSLVLSGVGARGIAYIGVQVFNNRPLWTINLHKWILEKIFNSYSREEMKRAELFHPRIFIDQKWAEGYYKRNAQNIIRVGRRFAKLLKVSGFSQGKILEVGCGFAAVPIELAKALPDVEITGIDLSEPLLDLGQILVDKAGFKKRITLLKGNAQDLNFEKDSFDVIVNTFLLHIVEHPITMLNEIERVAKPDAKIMITDLRRGLLALVVKKFKTAFTFEEAMDIIKRSELRKGKSFTGPFWWDYMAGM